MRNVVKLNADYLNIRIIHDDDYLVSLEKHLLEHGVTMPIFVTHCATIGEYDVLVQCDVIQALLNLHSRWLKDRAVPVPHGVYLKDKDDWYIDIAAGTWELQLENPMVSKMWDDAPSYTFSGARAIADEPDKLKAGYHDRH